MNKYRYIILILALLLVVQIVVLSNYSTEEAIPAPYVPAVIAPDCNCAEQIRVALEQIEGQLHGN